MTRVDAAGRAAFGILTLALVASGCGWILGLDEFTDAPPPSEGTGGQGGGCEPGATVACYDGPEGTEGVGICAGGTTTCGEDGMAQGVCEGQVTPGAETCVNPADEDCDGHDCVVWAKMFGDVSDQTIGGMAVDGGGNVYVAGWFNGTLAFDPEAPISANGTDLFVGKLDPAGKPLWSRSFGATSGTAYVSGIAVGPDGSLALAGTFTGDLDFDGTVLQASAYQANYVAKLTSDGGVLWSTRHSLGDSNTVASPAIDSTGDIILFGTSACSAACLPPTEQLWIRKLHPDGSVSWTKPFPSNEMLDSHTAGAVTVDPFDNIIITGSFSESQSFGSVSLTANGGSDVFVAKLDSTGLVIWGDSYGDAADQLGRDVIADSLGNVILVGTYTGNVNFGDPGDELTAIDLNDVFVAKLSSAKIHLWSRSLGGTGNQEVVRAAVDENNAIVLTGKVTGLADFGGGPIAGGGGLDLSLVKLAPDGRHLWSKVLGDDQEQFGRALATAAGGDTLLGAVVSGTIELGGVSASADGGRDILVARLAP